MVLLIVDSNDLKHKPKDVGRVRLPNKVSKIFVFGGFR